MKGIDFSLDPMWANTSSSLSEHVDGLRSFDIVKMIRDITAATVEIRPEWWEERSHARHPLEDVEESELA